jgi:hypothetical protein
MGLPKANKGINPCIRPVCKPLGLGVESHPLAIRCCIMMVTTCNLSLCAAFKVADATWHFLFGTCQGLS